MAPSRYYSSVARRTTLTADINASTTSITVAAATGFPSTTPYTLIIDQDTVNEEIVTVTNRSGTTLTVTRGSDGTSGVAHTAGASVQHGVSARDYAESRAHEDASEAVHGLGAGEAVVGTSTAQTISNKTLGSNLAAGGHRITGLGDPTSAQDAVTRNWAETGMTSQLNLATAARTAAEAAQSAAAASQSAAASSASAASSSASSASSSAAAASGSASAASGSASAAAGSESNAAASAVLANDWATKTTSAVAGGEFSAKYHAQAAASSASAASGSASAASSSASAAASSASAAAADAVAAAASASAAAATFDSFDDRYLGVKSSDPTVDNDGNPLVAGALYFSSALNLMRVYDGSVWVDTTAVAGKTITVVTSSTRPTGPLEPTYIYESDTNTTLVWNGSAWVTIGGGATGGGNDAVFHENDTTVTANYTITSGKNAGTFGPVTVNSGVTVTIPSGSVWTVV